MDLNNAINRKSQVRESQYSKQQSKAHKGRTKKEKNRKGKGPKINNSDCIIFDEQDANVRSILNQLESAIDQFVCNTETPENWKFVKEEDRVTIYKGIVQECTIHKIKAITEIRHCTMAEIMEFLSVFEKVMPLIDTMYESGSVLARLSASTNLFHVKVKSPMWPLVSNRDFVWLGTDKFLEKEKLGVGFAMSMDTDSLGFHFPEQPGYIRGNVLESGYIWKQKQEDPSVIELSYVIQADVKGMIPMWLVNRVTLEQSLNVARIRRYFAERAGCPEQDDCSDLEVDKSDISFNLTENDQILNARKGVPGETNLSRRKKGKGKRKTRRKKCELHENGPLQ